MEISVNMVDFAADLLGHQAKANVAASAPSKPPEAVRERKGVPVSAKVVDALVTASVVSEAAVREPKPLVVKP